MIDQLPQYRAHLSRHGHNLNHKFDFTSSTGHLLTLFSQILNPKETISGKIDMFSRTQPLNSPSHVDIDTYIDYFFVPLDMIYSGFGDTLYQTNEPYSPMIKVSPNTLPLFTFNEDFFIDFFNGVFEQSQNFYYLNFNQLDYYDKDSFFMSVYRNMFHNYLNPNFVFSYYPQSDARAVPADTFQPNILPLDLLAYNCVYENFYRLDEREEFDNALYNIDSDVYNQTGLFVNAKFYINCFGIKYRPLAFDYFTSAKVAPLINGINMRGGSNSDLIAINNYLSSQNISLTSRQDTGGTLPFNAAAGTGIPLGGSSSIINTNSLRSMFAVEKILSVTGRAKKTYDAQVMAHLGVNVPRDVKHEITFVGSQRGSIKVGEIIAVAGTSDTPLGDMAGKGYGTVSNKPIKFTAPCHGIFIAIYSAVPKLSYYAPLEKAHCITSRLDFWHPEFEKLGMQPIFGYEVVPFKDTAFRSAVYGWQMRYEQYKRRFDKVSPAFANTIINMGQGLVPTDIDYRSDTFNTWKNWVLSIRPFRQQGNSTSLSGIVGLSRFLSGPTDLNDIMTVRYGWFNDDVNTSVESTIPDYWKIQPISQPLESRTSFGWNVASLFYRDPLLHFANIDFKLISSMGENTLPDLNS